MPPLGRRVRLFRRAHRTAASGLHLYDDKLIGQLCHQVQLARGAAPVPVQDAVSARLQPGGCEPLPARAQSLACAGRRCVLVVSVPHGAVPLSCTFEPPWRWHPHPAATARIARLAAWRARRACCSPFAVYTRRRRAPCPPWRQRRKGHLTANAPTTIVFVHGPGDSARAWDGVIAALPEQPRPAPELPGHGAAAGATLSADAGVQAYADYVQAALARQGQAAVCLVGHSLGSAIALRLAVEAPALVSRLVLVGAGARLRVLPALLALAATSPDDAMRRVVELGFAPAHRAEADRYAAGLAAGGPRAVLRRLP